MVKPKAIRARRPAITLEDVDLLVRWHLLCGKVPAILPMAEQEHIWRSCRGGLLAKWRQERWMRGHVPWASKRFDAKPEVL